MGSWQPLRQRCTPCRRCAGHGPQFTSAACLNLQLYPSFRSRSISAAHSGGRFGSQGLFGGDGGGDPELNRLMQRGVDLSPESQERDNPLNYDPEGLFKGTATTLQDGHISRRFAMRDMSTQEEMEQQMQQQKEAALREADTRRAGRPLPPDDAPASELVDFLLSSPAEDMEYYIAAARPRILGPAANVSPSSAGSSVTAGSRFFGALDAAIGEERFLPAPNEERLAELEGLRDYVKSVLQAQDAVRKGVLSTTARLKALLSATDMRAKILEMAAANELDVALLNLLQQNIDGAQAAGQAKMAEAMTKIRQAVAKYVIVAPKRELAQAEAQNSVTSPKPPPSQGPGIEIA